MSSIFSTQNLQTFLRRKNLRPPSRPCPPDARSPRSGRSPRSPLLDCGRPAGVETSWFTSSALILLQWACGPLAARLIFVLRAHRGVFVFRGSGLSRWTLCPRLAQLLYLVQPLPLFIRAHSDELDHLLGYAQAALQFMDGFAIGQ